MRLTQHQISSITSLESEWSVESTDWLSQSEQENFDSLRHQRRRREWLAGRWLCKQMIQEERALTSGPTIPLSVIEIESRFGQRRTTKPRVVIEGQMQAMEVSMTHSHDWVCVAMSGTPGCSVGVDLVPQTVTNKHSLDFWLTENERSWVKENSEQLPIIWSIKESVYKATNRGEHFRPQEMDVSRNSNGRYTCHCKALTSCIDYSIIVDKHFDHIISMTTIQNHSLAGVV